MKKDDEKKMEQAISNVLRGNDIESAYYIVKEKMLENYSIEDRRVDVYRIAISQILNFVDSFMFRDKLDLIQENVDLKEKVKILQNQIKNNSTNNFNEFCNKTLKYYYELDPIVKTHLSDFQILHSININLDNPDINTQERLLNIINNVWLKDEENISESKVADEICEAYKNKEISLDSLEVANSRDLLQCVYGYENFSDYNINLEDLFYQVSQIIDKNKRDNIIFIDKYIIGNYEDIIEFLNNENEFFNKEGENYETSCRDIQLLKKYIQDNYESENIIGIENSKETGGYKLAEVCDIVEILEDIIEEQEECEDEEM